MEKNRLEAIEIGNNKYQGKQCKKCGNTLRYTLNSNCFFCTAESVKNNRNKVREAIRKAKEKVDQA